MKSQHVVSEGNITATEIEVAELICSCTGAFKEIARKLALERDMLKADNELLRAKLEVAVCLINRHVDK